jgi:hypothetical protein
MGIYPFMPRCANDFVGALLGGSTRSFFATIIASS